ncbi:MAG: DUF882 domain-containing protein [Syntrophaceae bacterium]|nr:DUF882 domain-containing protein [Deltaproteobacteria bacterium]
MKRSHVHTHPTFDRKVCRRSILKAGALALGGCIFPQALLGAVQGPQTPERSLSLYNLHTGESLKTVYWLKGEYLPDALYEINHILRDFRTEEIKPIDTGLLDLLQTLHESVGSREMLHIISGYRSPATNAHLREKSNGIARNSLHLQGKAADIRLPGYSLSSLRQTAVALKRGGVGYYPDSDFVHVDVGRVRYW